LDQWEAGARSCGLLDKYETPRKQDRVFSKYKVELITAEIITVRDDWVWMTGDVFEPINQSAESIFEGVK